MKRVLVIVKHRQGYGDYGEYGDYGYGDYCDYGDYDYWYEEEYGGVILDYTKSLSGGLLNSARFVVGMLNDAGVTAALAEVIDNNGIDREVAVFKPDLVVIEALFVVPSKFWVLQPLHPNVQWVVRLHSAVPFLAQEGMAISWITQYVQQPNVSIAANSWNTYRDLLNIVATANPTWPQEQVQSKVWYLPNYYPLEFLATAKVPDEKLDVACFGAIRPLKNPLIQAVAAIHYASTIGKALRFHMNTTRVELAGDNVLKNLRALFTATSQQLVEHRWLPREKLIQVMQHCDVGMQVSFSETFNIVAADMVTAGLPMVVSPAIGWASTWSQADPNNAEDIAVKLALASDSSARAHLLEQNASNLRKYCQHSQETWLARVGA